MVWLVLCNFNSGVGLEMIRRERWLFLQGDQTSKRNPTMEAGFGAAESDCFVFGEGGGEQVLNK